MADQKRDFAEAEEPIPFSEVSGSEHAETTNVSWTPEEEKRVLWKIDLLLLPNIWIMYLLSYMDRTKYVTNLAHS